MRTTKETSRRYFCNEDYFENIDMLDKAYWQGMFFADGFICLNGNQKCIGMTLSSVDKGHLEKLNSCLDSSYPIHSYEPGDTDFNTGEYSRLLMTSDKMFDDLARHGVVLNKTLVIQPPDIAKELRHKFILGYFDGDGCLTSYMKGGYLTYAVKIVGTEALLLWINDFIKETCGFEVKTLYKRRKTDEVYSLELHGLKRASAFLNALYKDDSVCLDRKYDKYKEMLEYIHSRAVRKRSA